MRYKFPNGFQPPGTDGNTVDLNPSSSVLGLATFCWFLHQSWGHDFAHFLMLPFSCSETWSRSSRRRQCTWFQVFCFTDNLREQNKGEVLEGLSRHLEQVVRTYAYRVASRYLRSMWLITGPFDNEQPVEDLWSSK